MKKIKLGARKLNQAPLKFQTMTLFKFEEGATSAFRTTDPTTATMTTINTHTRNLNVNRTDPTTITIKTNTLTRFESAEILPFILQNATLSF